MLVEAFAMKSHDYRPTALEVHTNNKIDCWTLSIASIGENETSDQNYDDYFILQYPLLSFACFSLM